jgi:glutamate 5-kinase
MIDPVRQEVIADTHTVVVKVGTNVLTSANGMLDLDRLQALADQVQRIRKLGRQVVLVSSGAIGAGMGQLGLARRPTKVAHLQACAAVGQGFLMQAYQECLARYGTHTAQVLLTAGDFHHHQRYKNALHTIHTLLKWGCLPIINENDTVSVDEIRFSDNDHLAALVTNMLKVKAPLLVLLSVVEGLFASDPGVDPKAPILTTVPYIDGAILDMAGASRSTLGTGGMRSKLRAAQLVTAAGESVIMANGTRPGILDAIFAAEPVGTLFLPHGGTVPAKERWLRYASRPTGQLVVDAGAQDAVQNKGSSLLPIGVVAVRGSFDKDDVVALCDADGNEFARGQTNYSAVEVERIRGKRTEQIAEILGAIPHEEVVHRDKLFVILNRNCPEEETRL